MQSQQFKYIQGRVIKGLELLNVFQVTFGIKIQKDFSPRLASCISFVYGWSANLVSQSRLSLGCHTRMFSICCSVT